MMKKSKYVCLYAVLSSSLLLSGCEKELMDYEGQDCLYFDVRRGVSWINPTLWPHEFFTDVAFGNIVGDEDTLSLRVMATGTIKDYDRPFQVIINTDSTTAVPGTDFSNLAEQYVIKAGETGTNIDLTAFRTERMDGDTLRAQLVIVPNEYFSVKFDSYGDFPGAYDPTANAAFAGNRNAAVHNIFFYDVLSKPTGWFGGDTGGGLFGKFSAKKYKYIMQVTNTTIEDFKTENMPAARADAISQQVAKVLLEQARKGEPVLDEDGTMMYVMAIGDLGGSEAWRPFTKPEDYYKNK